MQNDLPLFTMDETDLQERFFQSATTFRAFLRFRLSEKGKAGSLHAYGNDCAAVPGFPVSQIKVR
jgi:hypothetical protein